MADIHMVNIAGAVKWFQHWGPKPGKESWGGKLALRVQLPQFQLPNEVLLQNQQIFIEVKYNQKTIGTPRLSYILNAFSANNPSVSIFDTNIVVKQTNGAWEYSLRGNLSNFNILDSQGIEENTAIIRGKCISHENGWLQVVTSYRNPKAKKQEFRYVNVYSPNTFELKTDKWIYIRGKLATVAPNGTDSQTYVYADQLI